MEWSSTSMNGTEKTGLKFHTSEFRSRTEFRSAPEFNSGVNSGALLNSFLARNSDWHARFFIYAGDTTASKADTRDQFRTTSDVQTSIQSRLPMLLVDIIRASSRNNQLSIRS